MLNSECKIDLFFIKATWNCVLNLLQLRIEWLPRGHLSNFSVSNKMRIRIYFECPSRESIREHVSHSHYEFSVRRTFVLVSHHHYSVVGVLWNIWETNGWQMYVFWVKECFKAIIPSSSFFFNLHRILM